MLDDVPCFIHWVTKVIKVSKTWWWLLLCRIWIFLFLVWLQAINTCPTTVLSGSPSLVGKYSASHFRVSSLINWVQWSRSLLTCIRYRVVGWPLASLCNITTITSIGLTSTPSSAPRTKIRARGVFLKYKIIQDTFVDVYKWSLEPDSHLSLHINTVIINWQIAILAHLKCSAPGVDILPVHFWYGRSPE